MPLNTAQLKLDLIGYGINRGQDLPNPLANPFGLVHLVLHEKLAVSIHLNDSGKKSPFTLIREENNFFIENEQTALKVSVSWTPPLKCYEKKTSSGVLVRDILTVHGGFIAVHPRGKCRFGMSGLSCRYCGSTRELSQHPPFTKRDLIEAIRIVLSEKRCDVVHLSSGHVETEDGGVEWLTPWVSEVRRHVDILISLDLAPPKTNAWIDQAYAIGVDALYYDMDFTKSNNTKRHLEALQYASNIYPAGAVLSHLVIGLEPLEETRKSIDLLIQRGAVPILVYFPPTKGSALEARWTVNPSQVSELYSYLFEQLMKAKLSPHWVQQYDVVLTPLEGRFFSQKSPRHYLTIKNFYETGFGRRVRFGLASMRRHLRVREVPELL